MAEASLTGDHKKYTKAPAWRAGSLSASTRSTSHRCGHTDHQILSTGQSSTLHQLINPTKLASVPQPAIDEGLITHARADELIDIARNGISATEIMNLDGPALDLSGGNTTDPADESILLDFYFAQAGKSRVLMFPQTDAEYLETLAAVVLSASN